MPRLYRFGFESVLPQGVTTSGSNVSVTQSVTYDEYPWGTIDLLFVFDVITRDSLPYLDLCIAGAADYVRRYSELASVRFGVATVGQLEGAPYLNFYGWTDNSDSQRGYFNSDLNGADTVTNFERMLATVRSEADQLAGADAVTPDDAWVHHVLIPFLYGRFETGFKYWSQPSQTTPMAAVVPAPLLPLYYVRDAVATLHDDYNYYDPFTNASPVVWGFRHNDTSWKTDSEAAIYRNKVSAHDGGNWYAETVFMTPHPELWTAFASLAASVTTVARDISTWSLRHYLCIATDKTKAWESSFSSFMSGRYGAVTELNVGQGLSHTLASADIFARKVQSLNGTAFSGKVTLPVDHCASLAGRHVVLQKTAAPFRGTWTVLAVGNISVILTQTTVEVLVAGSSRFQQDIPALTCGINYDVTWQYAGDSFSFTIDGNEVLLTTANALLNDNELSQDVTAVILQGTPLVDNIAINSGDNRYARRCDNSYDGRASDFEAVDTGVPEPIQCFALTLKAIDRFNAETDTVTSTQHIGSGRVLYQANAIDYPWQSVQGVSLHATTGCLTQQIVPMDLSVQTAKYSWPLAKRMVRSITSLPSQGQAFYDEDANPLSAKTLSSLLFRIGSEGPLQNGMWLTYYAGQFCERPEPDLSLISVEQVVTALTAMSDLGQITGTVHVTAFVSMVSAAQLQHNAQFVAMYVNDVLSPTLTVPVGQHVVDVWLQFTAVQPNVSLDNILQWQCTQKATHYDPQYHGWLAISELGVGVQLEDVTVREGTAWSYAVPETAFTGVTEETQYSASITVLAADTETTTWYAFDTAARVFTGTPTNSDVGVYNVYVTVRNGQGAQISQSFKLEVTNLNTAPYVITKPAPTVPEENTGYLDLSQYFGDYDIVHGDALSYALYRQQLTDQDSLITSDYGFYVTADSSGLLRNTALTVMTMVSTGAIASDLKTYYGAAYDTEVSFLYASNTWQTALTPDQSKVVAVYIGSASYTTGNDTATMMAAIAETESYYGIILDTGGLQEEYLAALDDIDFAAAVAAKKIVYVGGVEQGREENYYYLKIRYALAGMGLYIEQGYQTLPEWITLNGSVCTFAPPYNALGKWPLVARATDSKGLYIDNRFNLTVTAITHAITATVTGLEYTFYHGNQFTHSLPFCFADLDLRRGDTPTLRISGAPQWLTIATGSRYMYGPAPVDAVDNYYLTYTATDGQGNKASVPVRLVAGVVPYIMNAVADVTMHYTETHSVNLADTFRYTGTYAYSWKFSSNGIELARPDWISLTGGILHINPTLTTVGTYSITLCITATDTNASVTDTFILHVVNNSPYYSSGLGAKTVSYQDTIAYDMTTAFVDPEGKALTYYYSGPAFLGLSLGKVTGQLDKTCVGTHTLTFTARDEGGLPATVTTTLTVVNQDPVLDLQPVSVVFNTVVNYDLHNSTTDENVNACTYTFSTTNTTGGGTAWLRLDAGVLTGTPAFDDIGINVVTVTVTDEVGATTSDSFVLTVYRQPRLLSAIPDTDTFYSLPCEIALFPHFETGQGLLTWEVTGLPTWASFDADTGLITGTPAPADVGVGQTVTVTVSEDDLGTARATTTDFVLRVVNRIPVFTGFSNQTPAYNATAFTYYVGDCFNDPDVDAYAELIWSVTGPEWLQWDDATKTLSCTPTLERIGSYPVTVTVRDRFDAVAQGIFTLAVINMPPFLLNAVLDVTTPYQDVVEVDLSRTFSDPEAPDALTWAPDNLPAWMNWNASSRRLLIEPTSANVGQTAVTVTARDEGGLTAQTQFMVYVTNAAPVLLQVIPDQSLLANTDSGIDVSTYFSDPEGSTLSYTFVNLPVWATAAATGAITGAPGSSQVGTTAVTVYASDSTGAKTAATFNVIVYDIINQPPEVYRALEDQILYALSGWTYNITGYFRDPDDDASTLVYTMTWTDASGVGMATPSWVAWDASSHTFSGTPPESAAGNVYSVTVRVTGTYGRYTSDTFNVVVYATQVLSCGTYYRDTDMTGSHAGAGQVVARKILLGSVAGNIRLSIDAYTYHDAVTLNYNGADLELVDPYDSTAKTIIKVGRDNPNEPYPAAASKTMTWYYPASGDNFVLLKIQQGPSSTDWRFRITCPV